MKKIIQLVLLGLCVPGFAQSYFELGGSAVAYQNSFAGASVKTRQNVSTLVVGRYINANWSAEAMTGLTKISDAPVYVNGTEVQNLSIKFNNAYGLYLKGHQPLNERLDVYARVGYASAKGSGSYLGRVEDFSENGMSYGVGSVFKLDDERYVSLNYLSFLNRGDFKIKVLGMNYGQRF
jgi:hypothetical protein